MPAGVVPPGGTGRINWIWPCGFVPPLLYFMPTEYMPVAAVPNVPAGANGVNVAPPWIEFVVGGTITVTTGWVAAYAGVPGAAVVCCVFLYEPPRLTS